MSQGIKLTPTEQSMMVNIHVNDINMFDELKKRIREGYQPDIAEKQL